jgi:steroid delta-isomerase-like uncharacterized protein
LLALSALFALFAENALFALKALSAIWELNIFPRLPLSTTPRGSWSTAGAALQILSPRTLLGGANALRREESTSESGVEWPGKRAEEDPMSEQNERATRKGIDEVWNGGRMEAIDEIVGAGYVRHDPALPGPVDGARELEEVVRLYRNAFPDLNIEIEEMHSAGDVVVTRWRASGTHRGDLMGLAPTGKHSQVTGMTLQRFSGGKVTDEFVEWDQLGMLRRLGVLPERDSVQDKALRTVSNLRTKVTEAIRG